MLYKHYFIESLEQLHEAGVVAPFYRVKSSDCKVPALNHYTTKHQQKKPQSLLFSLTHILRIGRSKSTKLCFDLW